MTENFQYKLTENQKYKIAQNLIDIVQNDTPITAESRTFIGNWILTISSEKRKAFFDVWDLVLRNFLPTTRPILFRACGRIYETNKIASFTGRLESARKFSEGKGNLIICDTNESLEFEERLYKLGEYKNTFYPLAIVLVKAKNSGGWGFSDSLLDKCIGEDEYIMRINLRKSYLLNWKKNKY